MISGDGISFPTLLITLDWWNRLLRKLMQYWLTGSPFHPADLAVLVCRTGKITRSLHYWCVTVLLFVPPIFCYFPMPPITTTGVTFKLIPVFSLSFGLLAERLRLGLLVVNSTAHHSVECGDGL